MYKSLTTIQSENKPAQNQTNASTIEISSQYRLIVVSGFNVDPTIFIVWFTALYSDKSLLVVSMHLFRNAMSGLSITGFNLNGEKALPTIDSVGSP